MKDKILPTVLSILPKKNRKEAVEQINYYLKELKYKSDKGQKFVLSDDKLEIIIYAQVVYQRVISPIKHSLDFYKRMTKDFNIDTISIGTFSLNDDSKNNLKELAEEFERIVYSFFISNGIERWEPILSTESIDDLIQILRTPEHE